MARTDGRAGTRGLSDAAPRRAGPARRGPAPSGAKGGAPGRSSAPGKGGRRASVARRMPLPLGRRALAVSAILAGLFVGLPLAQALLGELGALIVGCLVAGFALGRATARPG